MTEKPFIVCDNLVKIYKAMDLEVVALQGLDLTVMSGEMIALVGASGSGKSTLLNVIGGLDTPSAGDMQVGGYDLLNMSEADRIDYQRRMVGFVWQQPGRNLLPYLSAAENVDLPMMFTQKEAAQRQKRVMALLDILGLGDRADFRPEQISGGQQQRVALAVALANEPPLLLADEPTGQLDTQSALQIFDALREINQQFGTTIIVVTHDPKVAARVDRVIGIRDGRTSTEIRRERNITDGTMTQEEWVILDRTGRLQLPQVYVETLEMENRVKVRMETGHVSVWPEEKDGTTPAPSRQSLSATGGSVWRPKRNFVPNQPAVAVKPPAVEARNLQRTFETGAEVVHAVNGVSLTIPTGVLAVVKGRSGSGKTTLLNLLGGLDEPDSGTIIIEGQDLSEMPAQEKILLRRERIGFVFQTFGLMPFLSAQENIEAPMRLVRAAPKLRQTRTDKVLSLVGLTDRAKHRIHELSGGEQQRVALARALVNEPTFILADEPTGQLDTVTGSNIVILLKDIVEQTGVTVLIASHDPKVEEVADLVYELQDGNLIENGSAGRPSTT